MNKVITIFLAILLFKTAHVFAYIPQVKTTDKHAMYYEEAKFKKNEIAKSFYYIRHGQTNTSKYKIALGNVSLNEEGILQANKAEKLLQDKNIKVIVSSPLIRTKQTAEIINKELNVPIIYHDGLKEGGWVTSDEENISKSKNKKIWKKGGKIPGTESLYQFQMRIHNTVKEIVNKYDDVLIVGHGRYFYNLTILLNGQRTTAKNAIPMYLEPVSKNMGEELYKITTVAAGSVITEDVKQSDLTIEENSSKKH